MWRSGVRLVMVVAVVLGAGVTATACARPQVIASGPVRGAPAIGPIQTSTMRSRRFTLTIDVEPATVGTNEFHLYATTPDGHDAAILQWRVSVANPARALGPIDAAVLAITSGHAVGQVNLPATGTWKFTISVRTSGTDEDVVYTDVRIS
jgi:copper transport protein